MGTSRVTTIYKFLTFLPVSMFTGTTIYDISSSAHVHRHYNTNIGFCSSEHIDGHDNVWHFFHCVRSWALQYDIVPVGTFTGIYVICILLCMYTVLQYGIFLPVRMFMDTRLHYMIFLTVCTFTGATIHYGQRRQQWSPRTTYPGDATYQRPDPHFAYRHHP